MLRYTELLNLRSRMKLRPRETKIINRNERTKPKGDISKVNWTNEEKLEKTKGN